MLHYCQLSMICGLTPKRTASRPTETVRLFHRRHRAAMRWRASLGPRPTALPAIPLRAASSTAALLPPLRSPIRAPPLASTPAFRPWLPSCGRCPSAWLPIAPPFAVSWLAVALPCRKGAPAVVASGLTVAPPCPEVCSVGVLHCTVTSTSGSYHCAVTLSFRQQT
jgi:hypothetical protein